MYSQVKSGSLFGLASEVVIVETDLSPGLPAFTVVGLPDISVRESKERIRTAIINSGYKFPAKRITINLAPAGIKKEGTHFDLPIAVSVLSSIGMIPEENVKEYAFLGAYLRWALSVSWSIALGYRSSKPRDQENYFAGS